MRHTIETKEGTVTVTFFTFVLFLVLEKGGSGDDFVSKFPIFVKKSL